MRETPGTVRQIGRLPARGPAAGRWSIQFFLCLLALTAVPAKAQYISPDVQVKKTADKDYAHVEGDEVVIGNNADLASLQAKAAGYKELAAIKVVFKGLWFKPADAIAREAAAAIGANFLLTQEQEAVGLEELGAGAVRTYKAVRLIHTDGTPLYTRPDAGPSGRAASAAPPRETFVTPAAPVSQSTSPTGALTDHRHFNWLWKDGGHILANRLYFDLSKAGREETEQLRLYVLENFTKAEYKNFLKAYRKRSKIVVDVKQGSVR